MTDVSQLQLLAGKISSSSPAIRKWALAQAAASVSQEAAIAALEADVKVLRGSGLGTRPGPAEPPPSTPPLPSVFGSILAANFPRLVESGGSVVNVSSLSALTNAFNTAPVGSIINLTANLDGGNSALIISRQAQAGAPITFTCDPGVTLRNFSQILLRGHYLRLRGLDIGNASIDCIKIDVNANFVEVDGCLIHDAGKMGINVQASPQNVQLWNNRIYNNGSTANGNLDHGVYFAYARGACVIANNLFYDNCAYNLQVYPDAPNVVVTCNTLDGGQVHAGGRGGMVAGSETGLTDNLRVIGLIGTNAPWYAIDIYDPAGSMSGNQAFDSLGFGNGVGNFRAGGGFTYVNCTSGDPLYVNRAAKNYRLSAGSPAISKIQAARYGYVPPLDIDGNVRVTADAGCYRA